LEVEFIVLQANRTWPLVDKPASAHVITGKWVFKHKLNPDGMLERYKARWVVCGFNQRAGIDFQETFTWVVKPATIHTMLTIAASKRWTYPTPFFMAILMNMFCASSPLVSATLIDRKLFASSTSPCTDYVRRRACGSRGLPCSSSRLASRLQGQTLPSSYCVAATTSPTSSSTSTIWSSLLSSSLLQHVVTELRDEFTVKDMGELRFFLGINVQRKDDDFYLSQSCYAEQILDRAGMAHCKAASTSIDANGKLPSDGAAIDDATSYRSIAGVLQYLTITRPDLAFAVQQACLYMHDPRQQHLA
jgi:hypothetical protein